MGGQVQLMFDSAALQYVARQVGKATRDRGDDAKRSSALPNVPTIAESGVPGFDISTWYGIWAPAPARRRRS